MEDRGYDVSGKGVIKYKGRIIGIVEQISIHIYPEEIFLEIEKTPATLPLMKVLLDQSVPELEIVTEVGEFYYIAKHARVKKISVEGEKGKIFF